MPGKQDFIQYFWRAKLKLFQRIAPQSKVWPHCPWYKLLCEIWACNECIVCSVNIVGIVSRNWIVFDWACEFCPTSTFSTCSTFQPSTQSNCEFGQFRNLHECFTIVHAWSSGMGRQLYWICFKMDGIQHLLYCVVLKFNCSRFDSVLNI